MEKAQQRKREKSPAKSRFDVSEYGFRDLGRNSDECSDVGGDGRNVFRLGIRDSQSESPPNRERFLNFLHCNVAVGTAKRGQGQFVHPYVL